MVNCACGKPLHKVPTWLAGTTVEFVCNNCPNRTVKAITQVTLETPKDPEQDEFAAIVGEDEPEEDGDED